MNWDVFFWDPVDAKYGVQWSNIPSAALRPDSYAQDDKSACVLTVHILHRCST